MALFLERIDPEIRKQAKELWLNGFGPAQIGRQLGVKPGTVSQWAARSDWRQIRRNITQITVNNTSAPVSAVSEQSAATRLALARGVMAQAQAIADTKFNTAKPLANSKSEQGLAAIAKTIAETASIVFDWRSESKPGVLVIAGDVKPPDEMSKCKVIDIPPTQPTSESD